MKNRAHAGAPPPVMNAPLTALFVTGGTGKIVSRHSLNAHEITIHNHWKMRGLSSCQNFYQPLRNDLLLALAQEERINQAPLFIGEVVKIMNVPEENGRVLPRHGFINVFARKPHFFPVPLEENPGHMGYNKVLMEGLVIRK